MHVIDSSLIHDVSSAGFQKKKYSLDENDNNKNDIFALFELDDEFVSVSLCQTMYVTVIGHFFLHKTVM